MIFGKYINRYYKKYWYFFLAVLLSDAIVDIAQLLIPMIVGNVITIFSKNSDELSKDVNLNPLRVFTGFTSKFTISATETIKFYQTDLFVTIFTLVIIGIVIFIGRFSWRYFSAKISANIEKDLRKDLFTHIQTLSLSYYSTKKVGGLLSYFTNDVETIKQCFSDGLIFTTDLVVLGSTSIVLMSLISWQITLYTCIPLLLFIVLGGVIGKGESKRYKVSSDAFEDMSDFTEENLQGFSIIKAFRKEKDKVLEFKKHAQNVEKTSNQYLKYSSLIDFMINTYLSITFALLFFLGSYSIIVNGQATFSGAIKDVGVLSKFSGYYESLIWPMIAGGILIDYASRGNGARKRIATILSSTPSIVDDNNIKLDKIKGNIEFRHLNFKYPDSESYVLKDINFKVSEGTTVGIIGKTGSGKSTLVSLILKLYNLNKGELFIDNYDIMDLRKSDIRNNFSIVLQEAYLFSGTIKDNIAFSENDLNTYDENKVVESAKFASIYDDIMGFKDKFNTQVSEKGSSLSGGQRQRVSIARSYYKNPSLLILDDSLSAVDADTEKNIVANLKNSKNKITTFIITHRISTIENADLILVMDQGRIIAQGKHADLIENCKLYKDIVSLQQLEKEMN